MRIFLSSVAGGTGRERNEALHCISSKVLYEGNAGEKFKTRKKSENLVTPEAFLSFPNCKQSKWRILSTPQGMFPVCSMLVSFQREAEQWKNRGRQTHPHTAYASHVAPASIDPRNMNKAIGNCYTLCIDRLELKCNKIKLKEDLELRKIFSCRTCFATTPHPSKKRFIFSHMGNGKRLECNNPALSSGDKLGVIFLLYSHKAYSHKRTALALPTARDTVYAHRAEVQ